MQVVMGYLFRFMAAFETKGIDLAGLGLLQFPTEAKPTPNPPPPTHTHTHTHTLTHSHTDTYNSQLFTPNFKP